MSFLFNKNEERISELEKENRILKSKLKLKDNELKRYCIRLESIKDKLNRNADVNILLSIKIITKSYSHFCGVLSSYLKHQKVPCSKIQADSEFIRFVFGKSSNISKLSNVLGIPEDLFLNVKGDKKKKINGSIAYIRWDDIY